MIGAWQRPTAYDVAQRVHDRIEAARDRRSSACIASPTHGAAGSLCDRCTSATTTSSRRRCSATPADRRLWARYPSTWSSTRSSARWTRPAFAQATPRTSRRTVAERCVAHAEHLVVLLDDHALADRALIIRPDHQGRPVGVGEKFPCDLGLQKRHALRGSASGKLRNWMSRRRISVQLKYWASRNRVVRIASQLPRRRCARGVDASRCQLAVGAAPSCSSRSRDLTPGTTKRARLHKNHLRAFISRRAGRQSATRAPQALEQALQPSRA